MTDNAVLLLLLGSALGVIQALVLYILHGIRQSLHAMRELGQELNARVAVLEAHIERRVQGDTSGRLHWR